MRCSTCGIEVTSEEKWVKFKCPNCGKTEIVRCEKCKRLRNKYKCKKCGFEGP